MKRFVTVLTAIGISLAMTSCSFLPLDMLDDPADPEANSYQGFHLTDDPDKIVLSIPDNTRISDFTFIFSKVMDADEYQVQIANKAEFTDSVIEKFSPSNIVLIDLEDLVEKTHHPRYWRVRAFFDGEWRAWSKTGTFIYLHPKTVYFDAQGGDTPDPQLKDVGKDNEYGSLPTIQREGKVFDGWWTEPEGKGEQIFASTSVPTDEGHILYAKWLDTYLVTFVGNGNTEGTVPSQWKVHGNPLSLPGSGSMNRTGYYFDGWNTKADGSGTDYFEGSKYTQDSALTLYAKWRKLYKVGEPGPASGYVFYDKGTYSEGWRFLEAAPAGWYENSANDPVGPMYTWAHDSYGTESVIGSGRANTILISKAERGASSASVVLDYSLNVGGITYSDWFVPSYYELLQIYTNLHRKGLGGFSNYWYWSSTESSSFGWFYDFELGVWDGNWNVFKGTQFMIRPVRAF